MNIIVPCWQFAKAVFQPFHLRICATIVQRPNFAPFFAIALITWRDREAKAIKKEKRAREKERKNIEGRDRGVRKKEFP